MLACALLAPSGSRKPGPVEAPGWPTATRPMAFFGLGMAVTVLELPTALPYLAAIGALTRTDLAVTEWLPLLVLYNLIFVLPPLLALAGHVALGERADIVLGRLRRRLASAAREGFLWLLGLIGLFLLADALSRLEITNCMAPVRRGSTDRAALPGAGSGGRGRCRGSV